MLFQITVPDKKIVECATDIDYQILNDLAELEVATGVIVRQSRMRLPTRDATLYKGEVTGPSKVVGLITAIARGEYVKWMELYHADLSGRTREY